MVVESELHTEVALLAMTQDVGQPRRRQVDLAMQVVWLRRHHGEAFIEPLHERRQEGVAGFNVADLCEPQLLVQSLSARPNCVMPWPPAASRFMRKTECLSE